MDPILCSILFLLLFRHFPAGRLDKETSGLLILTNNGVIANKLTHPRHGHEKTYEALLTKPVPEEELDRIRNGEIWILGKKFVSTSESSWRITGRNYFTRREKPANSKTIPYSGKWCKKLRRVAIGNLRLEDLKIPEGEVRILKTKEIEKIV